MSLGSPSSKGQSKTFSPLLHAWHDPLAGLKVHTSCVKLADLECDGDSKLCICDLDKKLKIYKGTTLAVEYAILDTPVALCIIHSEYTLVSMMTSKTPVFGTCAECRSPHPLSCMRGNCNRLFPCSFSPTRSAPHP
jgi:hypothetical protein